MKYNFLKLVLLICLSHAVNSFGQTTFSKLYFNCFPCLTWGSAIEVVDSNYIIFGSGSEEYDGVQYRATHLISLDSLGEINLLKTYTEEDTKFYAGSGGSFQNINESRFIASGSYSNDLTSYGMLYYFDASGDTLWTNKYLGDGYSAFYAVDYYNDTIFAIGATRDIAGINTYMYLIASDTLGNTLFEQKYGNGSSHELGLAMSHFNNGNLVISGYIDNFPGTFNTDGKMYKTTSIGEAYFSKTYGTGFDDGGALIDVGLGDDYLLMLNVLDSTVNEGDFNILYIVSKLDTTGNYIWRTFLNRPDFINIWQFKENTDGSVMIIGTTTTAPGSDFVGYIGKISPDGVIEWEREHTTDADYDAYLFDIEQTPDKGYVLSGSAVGPVLFEPNQQMWVLKLDSMGCLIPGCGGTPIFNPIENSASVFNIFPNPTNNNAYVEIHIPTAFYLIPGETLEVIVYDLTGAVVDKYYNIPVNNPGETIRFNIHAAALANGMYQVQLRYGGNGLGSVKWMVQR